MQNLKILCVNQCFDSNEAGLQFIVALTKTNKLEYLDVSMTSFTRETAIGRSTRD